MHTYIQSIRGHILHKDQRRNLCILLVFFHASLDDSHNLFLLLLTHSEAFKGLSGSTQRADRCNPIHSGDCRTLCILLMTKRACSDCFHLLFHHNPSQLSFSAFRRTCSSNPKNRYPSRQVSMYPVDGIPSRCSSCMMYTNASLVRFLPVW